MSVTHPTGRTPPITPTSEHWLLLAVIVFFGASAFAGIRIAVATAPPIVVAAGRLWVAVLVITTYCLSTGRHILPLTENGRVSRLWMFASAIGVIGYSIPMILFPFAQQTISSMLAGIYMAFMPLGTVILAAMFADEPMTMRKVTGFIAGTMGVIILIGPAALTGLFSANAIAQIALLVATTGYAIATVLMRRAPEAPARSFAVSILLMAALAVTPSAILELTKGPAISSASWTAIVYLGLFPTGLASILILNVIRGAGAGFMAMGNYMTPPLAIVFGILLFGETLEWRYLFGLIAILIGVGIAQPGPLRFLRQKVTEAFAK